MKLFLHWLRWDLRRFRWPLLAWTALLTGFVCYLGWLHLNLLTIDPLILKYNEAAGAVLGIIEFFLILRILSSDPAAGVRPFWKTRPPAGYAVAGAKAAIAILFFLALPMLLQWLMYQWCHLGEPGPRWSGKSWPWMLWWTQCLAIGTLLLASSAAGSATVALTRLACGAIPLMAAGWLAMRLKPMSAILHFSGVTYYSPLEGGVLHAGNMGLWLAAGAGCFLWLRRTRTPSGWAGVLPIALPMAALLLAGALAPWGQRYARPASPPLAADLAAGIKIGEPLLRGGITAHFHEARDEQRRTVRVPALEFALHLAGLPEDCLAGAKWKSLRLTHPDGHTLEPPPELLAGGYSARTSDGNALSVAGPRFLPGALEKFSLTACRAEGTLSVSVYQWVRKPVPLEAGQRIETPYDTLYIEQLRDLTALAGGHGDVSDIYFGRELFRLTGIQRDEPVSGMHWQLQERALPECRIALRPSGKIKSGYFMEHAREDWIMPRDGKGSLLALAKLLRAAKENRLPEWDLRTSWMKPLGTVEVPVTLNDVFIPRQLNDKRKAQDIVEALDVRNQTPAELKRTIKLALAMPQIAQQESGDHTKDPLQLAIKALLATVPREHLAVLQEIANDDLPPGNMNMRQGFDQALCLRIAELMNAEDVARLRATQPRLLHYLRHDLAKRDLIPYGEAQGPGWRDMTDEALLKNWQASYNSETIYDVALEHAAPRGLPWVPAAVAEVAALLPSTDEAKQVVKFMSQLSDCPADPAAGVPWLQQNAAKLKWDPAAKRWARTP